MLYIMFQLTNDKIYIGALVLIALGVFGYLASMYIKTCVKSEIDDTKKMQRKKRKMMEKKQALMQQMMRERQAAEEQMRPSGSQPQNDIDMESYMDPVQNAPHGYDPAPSGSAL